MSLTQALCRLGLLLVLALSTQSLVGCGGQPEPKINEKPVPLPPAPNSLTAPAAPTVPTKPN
jgi:hypothetical protein